MLSLWGNMGKRCVLGATVSRIWQGFKRRCRFGTNAEMEMYLNVLTPKCISAFRWFFVLSALSLKRRSMAWRTRVCVWSSPRTYLLPSTDCCMRDKASVVHPKASNVYAGLCRLVNVPGCSSPSVLFIASSTLSCRSAASCSFP